MANFGNAIMENGEVKVTKEGYEDKLSYLSASSPRNITIVLSETGSLKVYVSSYSYYTSDTGISGAEVDLYVKNGSSYTLIKTVYSDSAGFADFGRVNFTEGELRASKYGYYNSSEIITFHATTAVVTLTKAVGNTSAEYPLTQADGSGCISPTKDEAPPRWVIGPPDAKGACFWEVKPIFGTFGGTISFSKLNLTISPNSASVNKPLEVFTSSDANCYEEALMNNFSSYKQYATFTPDVAGSFKGYAVSNGTASARCIAVKDKTNDGYGYTIDSVRVYQ